MGWSLVLLAACLATAWGRESPGAQEDVNQLRAELGDQEQRQADILVKF